jgi:hypothetical protein
VHHLPPLLASGHHLPPTTLRRPVLSLLTRRWPTLPGTPDISHETPQGHMHARMSLDLWVTLLEGACLCHAVPPCKRATTRHYDSDATLTTSPPTRRG